VGVLRKLYRALQERYLPEEALEAGLLDPSAPDEDFRKHCSLSTMLKIQSRLNPPTWRPFVFDKGIFYRYCQAAGLPIPPLLAIFSRKTPGWSCNGRLLACREEWTSYFAHDCPPEFVIKPSTGLRGGGIEFFRRVGSEFRTPDGRSFTPEAIHDLMAGYASAETFVIQTRLRNHPDLEKLHGTDALHTMRIATLLGPVGTCELLFAIYKIIARNLYIDNYCHGHTGNLSIGIDAETGVLHEHGRPPGRSPMTHPKSGAILEGCRVPFWPETLALVERAALKFAPIATIGWDIAVTPAGPVIIEGNLRYEIPLALDARPLLTKLRAAGGGPA
jgi:hypothetical protein